MTEYLDSPRLDVPRIPVNIQRTFRDAAAAELQEQIQSVIMIQPWYRKFANTISTIATGVSIGTGFLLLRSEDLPFWAFFLIVFLAVVAQALVVKGTKNGITESTATRLDIPFVADQMAEKLAIPFQRALVEAREQIPADAQRQIDTLADQAARYHRELKDVLAGPPAHSETPVTHERG